MGGMVLDLLLVALAASTGGGVAWWLRGGQRSQSDIESQVAALQEKLDQSSREVKTVKKQSMASLREADAAREEAAAAVTEAEHAKDALAKLQWLAQSMAANVSEHNTRVREINEELVDEENAENVVETVAKLIEANQTMQKQLESAEERLADQEKELETHLMAARTDALTKIANRRAFDDEMATCQQFLEQTGRTSSVMMIDVDHFKRFNDTHGHQAGDEVLRDVALTLTRSAGEHGKACRYGGEEFAVVFRGLGLTEALPFAERARAAIGAGTTEFEGIELQVTASGGLAELQPDESADQLVKRADDALYASKEAGRDCGYWHDTKECLPMDEQLVEEPSSEPNQGAMDPLTGLSMKATFDDDVTRRLAEWRRGGDTISVVVLDIDRFQGILKEGGSSVGDTVLRATAQFLRATMRDMDHVARYDDSCFTLLLPGASQDQALNVSERLRQAIGNCKLPGKSGMLKFTVSLGTAEVAKGDTPANLIERAQKAMKVASERGGNRSVADEDLAPQE